MGQELKPGSRWRSAVCTTEVIVVKAPNDAVALECGGHAMLAAGDETPAGVELDPARSDGTAIGKRFEHTSGLEVLCTKAGQGTLGVDGEVLGTKEAKPLPSSD
jgi:hypothetical protein